MKIKKKTENDETEWEDMELSDKIFFIIDQPFFYLRKITLPPCEDEKYQRKWAAVFPAPGLAFIYLCLAEKTDFMILGALIVLGLLISAYIWKTSPADNSTPSYYPAMQIFGTVGAIVWTYLVCGLLIDILQFLGMVSKLDKTYLGLTIIAVGNALPDAVTTIALAKQGMAVMGLTGAYGIY